MYVACYVTWACMCTIFQMDSSLQYIVSGGGDGAVRVWKMSNRELVTQYTEHRRGVSKVRVTPLIYYIYVHYFFPHGFMVVKTT